MRKLVVVCMGVMFAGLVGCGGVLEETPPPPPEMEAPGDSNQTDATELLGFDGPSEPLDGSAVPVEDGTVTEMMECGKPNYDFTATCRNNCYRVSTCGDGRPMFKCDSVTYEAWYSNVLWWREYANVRKRTVSSWWCANSAPNNCPGFCN